MPVIIPTQEAIPGALNAGGVVQQPLPGQELADGITQLAGTAHEIGLIQQRQRNADRLFQAETTLADDYRAFESEAQKRTGQNAWGITEDAAKWWSEKVPEYLGNLENDAQRQLFEESASKMRNSSLNSFSDFESAQRRASLEDSGRSAILSSIDFAAAHYADSDAVSGARTDVMDRVDALAGLNGWSPERREAEIKESLTSLHEQVIQNMADDDPAEAREYFEKNKSEIRGSAHDSMTKILDTGEVRVSGQQGADSIYDPEKTETQALSEARRQYKGKERDEVVARLKTRYAEDRAVQTQAEREATDQGWEIFSQTGTVASIPPSVYARMDPKVALSMRAQEFNPSDMVSTDWTDTYQPLIDHAVQNPAEFAKLDLRQYFDKLNIRERQYLTKLQTQILENGEAGLGGLTTQLTQAAREMGWNATDAEDRGLFERKVREQIAEFQKTTGKEADYEQRQTIIDRNLASGEVTGGGLFGLVDPDKRYFEVVGTPAETDFVVEIPDSARVKIEAALEVNGLPITDENVRNLYRAHLGL